MKLLHPKLRRLLQARLSKCGKDVDKRKAQRQDQKAVERARIQTALNELSESWREYLDASLLTSSRADILSELQPCVKGNARKTTKTRIKTAVSCNALKLNHIM